MPGEESEVSASSRSPFTSIVDFLPNDTNLSRLSQLNVQLQQCITEVKKLPLTPKRFNSILVKNHWARYGNTVPDILRREFLIFIWCCPNVYCLMAKIFSSSASASDDYYVEQFREATQKYRGDSNPLFNHAIAEWAAQELAEDLQDHLIKDITSESSKNLIEIFNQLLEFGSITAYEQPIVILLKLFKAEIFVLMRSDPALLREMLGYYQDPESYPKDAKFPPPYAVQLFFKLAELLKRDTLLSPEMEKAQIKLRENLHAFIVSVEREMQKPEEYHPHQACGFNLRLA